MKKKISIVILIIIIMTSLYVYKDKRNKMEYNDILSEFKISQSENKKLTIELKRINFNLDELEDNLMSKDLIIELKDKEIVKLNNNVKNMQNYVKNYKEEMIYVDHDEENRSDLDTIFFDEYETQLFSTKNIDELLELYKSNLDGAYSYGYGGVLYDYYTNMNKMEFIKTIEQYTIYKTNGIIDLLISDMSITYFNDGGIDMEKQTNLLLEVLDNNELSYKEKYIVYKIISEIEEMVNYRETHPDS